MLKKDNSRKKHKVSIALEITTRCHGNCSHCYLSCTPEKGIDINFEDIKKINRKIKEVNKIAEDFIFSMSSVTGGDPFLYNKDGKSLINVVNYLQKYNSYLDIHVSGWNKKPSFLDDLKNINYYISYTAFMPNSKNRIRNSISDLEKITNHLVIDVITIKNRKEKDYLSLEKILKALGYKLRGGQFIKKSTIIDVYIKEVFPYGRGENIVKDFPRNNICSITQDKKYSYHYLDNLGNLYVCARAGAKYTHPICNFLEDKPKEILTKYILFYNSKIIFNYLEGNTCKKCKSQFNSWTEKGCLQSSEENMEFKKKLDTKINNIKSTSTEKKNLNYLDGISLAYSYEKKGDLVSARKTFNKVLKKANKESNYQYISEIYKDLSIIDRIEKKLPDSIDKLKKALNIAKKHQIKRTEANVYGNLGIISFLEGDYTEAIKFHQKAIDIHKKRSDEKRVIPNISFLGINYLFQGKKELARKHLFKALERTLESGYREGLADTLYYLAIYSLKAEEYFKSYIYAFLALDLYWRIPDLYKYKQTSFFILNLPEIEKQDFLVRKVISSYNIVKKLF